MAEEKKKRRMSDTLQSLMDINQSRDDNYVVIPKGVLRSLIEYQKMQENYLDSMDAFIKGIREGIEKAKAAKEQEDAAKKQ